MRIILVCSGSNDDFYDILTSLTRELYLLGITERAPHNNVGRNNDLKTLWRWLSDNAGGTKVQFLADGFYSADLIEKNRAAVQQAVLTRLSKCCDVDLILSFGTWAAQDMVALNTKVPVVACGITDPVDAGIVPSETDSGKSNFTVILEPDRFLRQLELFHKVFAFKRLGITYTETPTGRSIAAIDQIETACKRHGVELVRCNGDFFHNPDSNQIAEQLLLCNKKFVEQHVDAVYITYNSLDDNSLPYVLEPLIQAGIPSLSQEGSREVRRGVLASISNYSAKEGRFAARLLRGLLEGAKLHDLPHQLHSPLLLAINVQTATRIGWNPPLEVLLMVDEFFQ